MSKNVLFIHGFGGDPWEYKRVKQSIAEIPGTKIFDYCYAKKWGNDSLKNIAQRCCQEHRKNKIDVIIGFSQGGIIAALANEQCGMKAKAVITICTPWQGTVMASLFPMIGAKQLRFNSPLLKELQKMVKKSKAIYFGVYNPLDVIVFPGISAINDNAAVNERIFAATHITTFFLKKTRDFCVQIIKTL